MPSRFKLEGGMDNNRPRHQQAQLTGLGERALGAQNNAFEALPFFLAAVTVAFLSSVDKNIALICGIVWVVARILHGAAYLANVAPLRSLGFMGGLGANIALFYFAATGGS